MAKKNQINRKKHERRRIENNKHLKEIAVEKKFRDSTQRILDVVGVPNLIRELPKKEAEIYYKNRFMTVRLLLAPGMKVPRRTLTQIRYIFSMCLKVAKVSIGSGSVTLEEFMTAGWSLDKLARYLSGKKSPVLIRAAEALTPITEIFKNPRSKQIMRFLDVCHILEVFFSRINGTYYRVEEDFESMLTSKDTGFFYAVKLSYVKAICKEIKTEGKKRPAYKLGLPHIHHGLLWIKLTGRELGIDSAFADTLMEVYVQSHTLVRLRERLDTLDHSCLHDSLMHSFMSKDITVLSSGRALMAYYYNSLKLGYCYMEVIDGVVVVKTFLFITNTGAPEGDRLDSELNIGKVEKQFVGIDKLSTFVYSDILHDERVRKIFTKVGLEHLCKLTPGQIDKRKELKKGYAADFIKYMNVDGGW